MTTEKISLGKKGEELVALYLKKQGYTICACNYTKRCGEIDIIAQKDHVRAFVEVKLRQSHYFTLSEVVTPAKQRKIITTARFYNSQIDDTIDMIYRFDIALVEHNGKDYDITYIPNAFTQGSEW
jgi:putative endonuclease